MSTKQLHEGQMSIFDLLGLPTPEEHIPYTKRVRMRRRSKSKKGKGKKEGGGLQYKIQLRIRKTDRKLPFRTKAKAEEGLSNAETAAWTDNAIMRLCYALLIDSLLTLRHLSEYDSEKAAEILLWIASESWGPFSFNQCVLIAGQLSIDPEFRSPFPEVDTDFSGVDPDDLRRMCFGLVKKQYGEVPGFFTRLVSGLQAVATGSREALDWCLSEDKGPMSYQGCCSALGFEPMECLGMIEERRQKMLNRSITPLASAAFAA